MLRTLALSAASATATARYHSLYAAERALSSARVSHASDVLALCQESERPEHGLVVRARVCVRVCLCVCVRP